MYLLIKNKSNSKYILWQAVENKKKLHRNNSSAIVQNNILSESLITNIKNNYVVNNYEINSTVLIATAKKIL